MSIENSSSSHIIPDESLPSHSVFVRHVGGSRVDEMDSFASIPMHDTTTAAYTNAPTLVTISSSDFTANGNPLRVSNESVTNSFKKGKSNSNSNTPQSSPASTPTRNRLRSTASHNINNSERLSMKTTSIDTFGSIMAHGLNSNVAESNNNFVVSKPSLNSKPPLPKRGSAGGGPPRPFLKRGSRKEPSALHRVNSKSPTNILADRQGGTAVSNFNSNGGNSNSSRGDIQIFAKPHATKPQAPSALSNFRHSNIDNDSHSNTYMENTDEITSILLQTKQLNATKELDEFLLLERELEAPSATTFVGSKAALSGGRAGGGNTEVARREREYDYYDDRDDDDDDDSIYLSQHPSATKNAAAYSKYAMPSDTAQTAHDNDDDDDDDNDGDNGDYIDDGPGDSKYIDSYYNKYSSQAKAPTNNRPPAAVVLSKTVQPSNDYGDNDDYDDRDDEGYDSRKSVASASSRPTITWSDKFKPVSFASTTSSVGSSGSNVVRSRPATSSGQGRNSNTNVASNFINRPASASAAPSSISNQNQTSQMQMMISEKAKELESELQFYRQENSNLKKLKMKQESTLSEVLAQRTEMIKWIDEEKLKTAGWCEEQRAQATRDRRAAAKVARDMRQKATSDGLASGSVRKEKAEIDALTATIEKMKIDSENNNKKYRMNDKRLNSLIKELSEKNEELGKKIIVVETEKINIANYLEKELAIKLPSYLLTKAEGAKIHGSGKNSSQRGYTSAPFSAHPDSYVEEASVEDYSSYIYRDNGSEAGSGAAITSLKSSYSRPPVSDERNSFNRVVDSQANSRSSSIDYSINFIETNSNARGSDALRGSFNSISSGGSNHNIINQINNSASTSVSGRITPVTAATSTPHTQNTVVTTTAADQRVGSSNEDTGGANSRIEEVLPDGGKVVKYRNGTIKNISPDGSSLVQFTNGDTKHINALNSVVIYYYAQARTKHTTFPDGLEVYEFPNKQIERHFSDGTKEIVFPDNTKKIIRSNGVQESYFPDGVIVKEFPNGSKEIFEGNKVQLVKSDF